MDCPSSDDRVPDSRWATSNLDPTGAMLHGGRWNSVGRQVLYAAESYAGAMLEVLVHANLSVPPKNHRVVRIVIPEQVGIEKVQPSGISGWDSEDYLSTRRFGDRWIQERRTAVLLFPGVVTEGRESNVLLNPLHPQFLMIQAGEPEAVRWDHRLFVRNSAG